MATGAKFARERLEARMGERRPAVVWKSWAPRRIGPRFDWLDYEHIRLIDGPLAERVFRLNLEFSEEWAMIRLSDGDVPVGEASIEHDPPGRGIVLWDVGVKEGYRGGGLASIMVWTIFRELLLAQHSATFRIRMVQSHKPAGAGAGSRSAEHRYERDCRPAAIPAGTGPHATQRARTTSSPSSRCRPRTDSRPR